MMRLRTSATALASVALSATVSAQPVAKDRPATATVRAAPTAAAARAFVDSVERRLAVLSVKANQAGWVAATYITDDTEALSADVQQQLNVATQRYALAAKRYDGVAVPPDVRRKLSLLKLSLTAPPPSDPAKAGELTRLTVGMEGAYGKGTYCRHGALGQPATTSGDSTCYQINDLSRALVESRDPAVLLDAWRGWHAVGAPLRPQYQRFVALANQGARELGFDDAGAMWRSNYDMPADQFPREVERLWKQVEPLYVALHAYVRTRLNQQYGDAVVAKDGLIPAHLLGNMWAQEWGNVYPLVAPPNAAPTFDLTALLKAKSVDAVGMARYADRFFQSLGFAPLPATFFERSMLVKPRDREVVCHASAWDIDNATDVRVKACLEPTGEDFVTIHHEEGHNFYQRAYARQPFLFENGANDGFHEAIGDAIALAITPSYLQQVGLLAEAPSAAADTALLLRQALDKVAFLPFGLMIDQWRWGVFSGAITPANYNKAWWDLRAKYQGVAPPVARTEADFDPAAKYHVPANVPYMRYFLARVLQFQFYRAMCRSAGHTGPLYRCSFYGSKEAGAKLARMLEAGQSKPWQDTLYEMTGERDMDAGAMLEYFEPLKAWLDRQNAGHPVGWSAAATR
jgi:peptidyl-dipeptidase A